MKHPRLSSADHVRLQQQLDSIRDAENTFGGMANEAQWGDTYDRTIYRVPSNDREWTMTQVGHRMLSDSTSGDDPTAAQAHIEIDAVRMGTLAAGLDHFEARGPGDQCLVVWTNQFAQGPSHTTLSVPHIVWGSASPKRRTGTRPCSI